MERVRPPRSSDDDAVPETIGPLPGTRSMNVLLDELRSPGVTQADVEEFLRGLDRPLAEDESARARADFLLSVIEARDLGDVLGKGDITVRGAAVKALLDLGYPYALEIPPEALAEIRRARQEPPPLSLPVPGLIATGAGLLTQAAECLPPVLTSLNHMHPPSAPLILLVLIALLGPASVAVLAGLLRMTRLLKWALGAMGVTGVIWVLAFLFQLSESPHPARESFTYLSLVAGFGFLVGAVLMRPKAWLPEDEAPANEETPSTKT